MAETYFVFDPFLILQRWRSVESGAQFPGLILNLAQVDLAATQDWIRQRDVAAWAEQLKSLEVSLSFDCLLVTSFVDSVLAKQVLGILFAERYSDGTLVQPDELALIGLYRYLLKKPDPNLVYPTPRRIASWLSEEHLFTDWAFSVYA